MKDNQLGYYRWRMPKYVGNNAATQALSIPAMSNASAGTHPLESIGNALQNGVNALYTITEQNHQALAQAADAKIQTAIAGIRQTMSQVKGQDALADDFITRYQDEADTKINGILEQLPEGARLRAKIMLSGNDYKGKLGLAAIEHQARQRNELEKVSFETQAAAYHDELEAAFYKGDAQAQFNALANIADISMSYSRSQGYGDELTKQNAQNVVGRAFANMLNKHAQNMSVAQLELSKKMNAGLLSPGVAAALDKIIEEKKTAAEADSQASFMLGGMDNNASSPVGTSVFNNVIIPMESGGRQFDAKGQPLRPPASPTGKKQTAVGIGQITESAAIASARDMGESVDWERLKTNKAYNHRLSLNYFNMGLRKFNGSIPLAILSYNAGAGTAETVKKELAAKGILPTHPDYWDYVISQARNSKAKFGKNGADYLAKAKKRFNGAPPLFSNISNENKVQMATALADQFTALSKFAPNVARAVLPVYEASVNIAGAEGIQQVEAEASVAAEQKLVAWGDMMPEEKTKLAAGQLGLSHAVDDNGAFTNTATPDDIKRINQLVAAADKRIAVENDAVKSIITGLAQHYSQFIADGGKPELYVIPGNVARGLSKRARNLVLSTLDANYRQALADKWKASNFDKRIQDGAQAKLLLDNDNARINKDLPSEIPLDKRVEVEMAARAYEEKRSRIKNGLLPKEINDVLTTLKARGLPNMPKEGTEEYEAFALALGEVLARKQTVTGHDGHTFEDIANAAKELLVQVDTEDGLVITNTMPRYQAIMRLVDRERDKNLQIIPWGKEKEEIKLALSQSGVSGITDEMINYVYTAALITRYGDRVPQEVINNNNALYPKMVSATGEKSKLNNQKYSDVMNLINEKRIGRKRVDNRIHGVWGWAKESFTNYGASWGGERKVKTNKESK